MNKTVTICKRDVMIMLDRHDIIDLLKRCAHIATGVKDDSISVDFRVPSGGDYSGMYVEITSRDQVRVTYTEVVK